MKENSIGAGEKFRFGKLRSRGAERRVRRVRTGKTPTTYYLPDINVWLALSWDRHRHSAAAWSWFGSLDPSGADCQVLFCRITQLGLLRLLTTNAVVGADTLTISRAWEICDRWRDDVQVTFSRESAGLDDYFRMATAPFADIAAPKALGDCYLLAVSRTARANLVTLDGALFNLAVKVCPGTVQL